MTALRAARVDAYLDGAGRVGALAVGDAVGPWRVTALAWLDCGGVAVTAARGAECRTWRVGAHRVESAEVAEVVMQAVMPAATVPDVRQDGAPRRGRAPRSLRVP